MTHCEPDHPWPTRSKWLESSLDCSECRKTFELEDRSNYDLGPVVLVKRSEVDAQAERKAAYAAAADDLMLSPMVKSLVERFVERLETEPSVAAVYRLMTQHFSIVESVDTFRKKVRELGGIEGWAREYAQYWFHLSDIVDFLGSVDAELVDAIARVNALEDVARAPIPIIGDPIVNRFPK